MARRRLTIVPPVPPGAALRPPLERVAFPLADRHCRWAPSIAAALRLGVSEAGLAAGDALLVPARGEPALAGVLERGGLTLVPYRATPTLEPDADELERLLGPSVRALCIVHQLGFAQDVERWRAWCDGHGLLLVEDASRALGAASDGRPVGALADLAIFDLAACLGLPDGAIARLRGAPQAMPDGAIPVSDRLFRRLAGEDVAARRRAHHAELVEQLGTLVPAPFRRLDPGAAPYALPLHSDGADELYARLRRRGVQVTTAWPAPPDTVLVPVHQQLRAGDLRRIAAAACAPRPRPARDELSLDPLEGFEALPDEWRRLAQTAGTVFATPEWLGLWWRHFGREDGLRLFGCRDRAGRLAAILALELRPLGPLVVARFVGHGPSDELGPICGPADRPAVARALTRALDAVGADALLAEQLPGDAGWDALLHARTLSTEGNPVATLAPGGWEAQLRRWTPSVGRQLARHTRKLERAHDVVRTRRTIDAAELERDVDALMTLHDARWGAGATAFGGRDAPFHREFLVRAHARGWLSLSFLEVDGVDVAAVYNLRFAGVEHQYQQGRLPAWEEHSVGTIALLRSIRDACDAGMRAFRFLRGGEPYKYRYADADPGLRTIALARRPGAAGAIAVASAVPRALLEPARRRVAA